MGTDPHGKIDCHVIRFHVPSIMSQKYGVWVWSQNMMAECHAISMSQKYSMGGVRWYGRYLGGDSHMAVVIVLWHGMWESTPLS